ncbi:MAG: alanine--tRNA ligase [Actinobacteria bacterium]|nr:alanine--tRNA ligase [Actinomycetota bacterium]
MDIRNTFLEYFKNKAHLIMPSASLVPSNDTSVLLTTAGMQQFKPYYLGTQKPPGPRIATVQKCFRTSDIERVGTTEQHLTFFEMLGNFAFADYFKKEAVDFALEYLLDVLNISLEKLAVGVFAGDETIPEDVEAIKLWKGHGIKTNRIYKYGKSDNFWGPAGDTGPCGPCTEIYYDFGSNSGCGSNSCSPGCGCERYLEIWNLVFTQYNFNGKNYEELPNKNIDTGMGLERIAAVLLGDPSVFKTGLFMPVVKTIEKLSGAKLLSKNDESYDAHASRCIKIIADHSRAVAFLAADGVIPANESRGYILRRLLRRAVRFGRLLNIKDCFLNELAEIVIDNYGHFYPELEDKKDEIYRIIGQEEKKFLQTLKEGSKVLSLQVEKLKSSGGKYLEPSTAFKLYETYGFPVELTAEILNENGFELQIEKFDEYMAMHSEKSRKKTAFDKKIDTNLELYKRISKKTEVDFIGYQELRGAAVIMHLLKHKDENGAVPSGLLCKGDRGEIILDSTPFYAEKGGEIGDRGAIKSGESLFIVEDTQMPVEGLVVHRGWVKEGAFKVSDSINTEVDAQFRKSISSNHTSTHMLHWALRAVFGKNIEQAGSFVSDERLRFDYSIASAPVQDDFDRIERLINEKIQRNDIVRCFETTREYAQEIGAISLFNEKYGKFVRVVEIDDYSRELCGGIHVSRTGEIGLLKILSDSSIGAGTRRIEAITGTAAFNFLNSAYKMLKEISSGFDSDILDAKNRVDALRQTAEKLADDLGALQAKSVKNEIMADASNKVEKNGTQIIVYDFSKNPAVSGIDAKNMGIIGDELINEAKDKEVFILFVNIINSKPFILMLASKELARKGVNCSVIAKDAGKILKGGGGGKPEFAQVGGSDSQNLAQAILHIKDMVLKLAG